MPASKKSIETVFIPIQSIKIMTHAGRIGKSTAVLLKSLELLFGTRWYYYVIIITYNLRKLVGRSIILSCLEMVTSSLPLIGYHPGWISNCNP